MTHERPKLNHTSGKPNESPWRKRIWIAVLIAVGVAFGLTAHAIDLRSPIAFSSGSEPFGQEQPVEFLYLDSGRVEAYLAQLEGGTFASQRLSHKLTKEANAGVSVNGVGSAGVSSQDESFIEREVTATAASRYLELLHDLQGELNKIGLRHFKEEVRCSLSEGDFVLFRTRSLRPPTYLNPYLAVSQSGTLSALFPMPSRDPEQRELVESRREASRQFRKQVGEDPRVVFAIQPRFGDELGEVKYLLPMNVAQLADERSLLKYGGGTFTVVGKVVRLFSKAKQCPGQKRRIQSLRLEGNKYAYVDSPTRETWEHPLEGAPGELVCRTNRDCASEIHQGSEGVHGAPRQKLIGEAREEILSELTEQTQIQDNGAVIIPVAIYK